MSHDNYRTDIDGLRAFAILSVVAFHAFPDLINGGFVGVDIFFVISGFLISGILFESLANESFSIADFYAKRVKRIFPALIFVLIVSTIVAWFILFSDELNQFGVHLMRASVFLSNFILWNESGYFDNAAETKPLLHLWSLAIEEQFYILWPIIVWIVWKAKQSKLFIFIALAVASFIWNVYQSEHDSVHDFYSPLTRFWELLSGAVLAYIVRFELNYLKILSPRLNFLNNIFSVVGLLLIIYSAFEIGSANFPGVWAFIPIAGACLIIFSGPESFVNRYFFSSAALVWVGKISYPLYLWHWPILSFSRILEGGTPSVLWRMLAVILSFVLAKITFELIERPLRFKWSYRHKIFILVFAMLLVGLAGHFIHKAAGYPNREIMSNERVVFDGDIGHDKFHDYFKINFFPCTEAAVQKTAGVWKGMVRCFQSKSEERVDLVILGDSHAEHLFIGFSEATPHLNIAFYSKGALPVLDEPEFDVIFKSIISSKVTRSVLISVNWEGRLKARNDINWLESLDKTIKAIVVSGKSVAIMVDIPQFGFDVQRCKFKRPIIESTQCDVPFSTYTNSRDSYLPMLRDLIARNPGVQLIDISDLFCTRVSCSMVENDSILYRDDNHLNIVGSKLVGKEIAKFYTATF